MSSWLQQHDAEINASEKRRLDNRLRAQRAFAESRHEVDALRKELNITRGSSGMGYASHPTDASHPTHRATQEASQRSDLGMVNTPSRHEGFAFDMDDPKLHPPQPIGEVRDVAVLKEALIARDQMIDRLQRQIQHDRSFYSEQLQRMQRNAEEERSEHNSRVASLRGQLDELARKQNDALHIASAPLTDGARKELEDKIEELQALFHSGLESVKSRTAQALEEHHGRMDERVSDITDAAQRAIAASREVFRQERLDAIGLTQESVLNAVSRDQDTLISDSENKLRDTLYRTLSTKLTSSMEDLFRRQLLSHLVPAMEAFLTTTLRERLTSHLENDLEGIYTAKTVAFNDALESSIKSAERRATELASSLIRFDSAAFSKELKSAVDSIEALRSQSVDMVQANRSEHLDFMLRLQRLYEEGAKQQRLMSKFSDILEGGSAVRRGTPSRSPPMSRSPPVENKPITSEEETEMANYANDVAADSEFE